MIRVYEMRRRSGQTWSTRAVVRCCERHLEARKILGWAVDRERQSLSPQPSCDDCETAKAGTVLERAIEAADAEADGAAPKPVPVLPGQGQLFGEAPARKAKR